MTYDFLGRLYESRELTSAQATYSRARYSYNELDQMTKIEHFNGDNDGGAKQERTFVYDGYARLQSETTPETGTSSYGTGCCRPITARAATSTTGMGAGRIACRAG